MVRSWGMINPDNENWSIAITKDDQYVFVAGAESYLSKFDIVKQAKVADFRNLSNSKKKYDHLEENLRPMYRLNTNTGTIYSMKLVNNDKELWFSCSLGNVRVWDLENDRVMKVFHGFCDGILFSSCV